MKGISGIESDSRKVKKGYAFVAIRGLNHDGHDFIDEAVKNGATEIYGERNIKVPEGIKYIKVLDSRETLGELASKFYGRPSEKLKVIGVTGTDGKTTTAHFLYWFLINSGKKAGLISTVSAIIGEKVIGTGLHVTNPDPVSLQKLLSAMVDEGCEYAVVEVTSHGIDQQRIAGVEFDTAILTKITNEHLDYHKTFAKYRDVKLSLLKRAKNVIINKDDYSYGYLLDKLNKSQKIIAYSRKEEADVYASEIHDTREGISFYLNINKNVDYIKLPIAGIFNVSNLLAAFATVNHYRIPLKRAIASLQSFKLPTGRMEKIETNRDYNVIVDFAHTPDALNSVLSSLRKKTLKRLICVSGCAGERDRSKRFVMGKISASIADVSVFTAEDPRSENIFDILRQMKKGALPAQAGKNFVVIPERGEAIAYALSIAKKGDLVVITGKGHEKSMAYSSRATSSSAYRGFEHPWSDQEAVGDYLNKKEDVAAVVLAAGKGTRMKSATPKVLLEICGRPMISYTLEKLRKSGIGEIVVVVSYGKGEVIKRIGGAVKFAYQKNSKGGTADAAAAGLKEVSSKVKTLVVINGDDSAFYNPETINNVIATHKKTNSVLTFVSLERDNPHGLGRVVRSKTGKLMGIVEEKDATELQRKIKEVNDGLYVFEKVWLEKNIGKVKLSSQGEYYLVDLIKMAVDKKEKVSVYNLKDEDEWQRINTPRQLKEANELMKKRLGVNTKA